MQRRKFKHYVFTAFGKITKVEDGHGWIHIYNEAGSQVSMKKVYAQWQREFENAQAMAEHGMSIVYRTGASAPADDYFNRIYADDPLSPILEVPDDAGPVATEVIVMERIWSQDQRARDLDIVVDSMEAIEAERDRYKKAWEQQDKTQKNRTRKATNWLNQHFNSKLRGQSIRIAIDLHAKRRLAMRLGINAVRKSNIVCVVEGREENNFLAVTLPEFNHIMAHVAVHIRKDKSIVVATANMGDKQWWDHERRVLQPGEKDLEAPIDHYLALFQRIAASRFAPDAIEAESTKDRKEARG